jgi:hypothetical protein
LISFIFMSNPSVKTIIGGTAIAFIIFIYTLMELKDNETE